MFEIGQQKNSYKDDDPIETKEWLDSLNAVLASSGVERAQYLLRVLGQAAQNKGIASLEQPYSAYRNSIDVEQQGAYPGNLELEEHLTGIMRWNALAMVMRANRAYGGLGGHIASYASAAEIFEVGFHHFFKASSPGEPGDLVYFQPHSAPGIYARAFLEGRLSQAMIANYRQEVGGDGLCSYPHPQLMPEFWQFPTGSMGIGPLGAVYQARFMRYLSNRGLADTTDRHVWGVFGDGEMDEPESLAGLTLAAREQLDNVTFIINCNLQRLDGPVRGNGQIIQELESLFVGAGWHVIKVLWGSEWDSLFARDKEMALLRRFAETVDGQYQDLGSKDGDYNRIKFFDSDPETRALVKHMTDSEINSLKRGGHDFRKLHAAFAAAKMKKGKPTVILAKTKKGYGMGKAGESRMVSHQAKKLDLDSLREFRDRFQLPLEDADLESLNFYKPAKSSDEMRYLHERRAALGGYIPTRISKAPAEQKIQVPPRNSYAQFADHPDGKSMSTTMAAVRMMGSLLKDKNLGPSIVPIVADEARTFGMDALFRPIGIYSPKGQLYQPEDSGSITSYKETATGQLLQEGINEAGAMSSWTAAATAYSAHEKPMLPFYIFYSMFGFQRVGDFIWAAADQRARGFLFGATAGRTTLSGEGLQHQDGTSQLIASTVPNCLAYDPAYAYELAIILSSGMNRMLDRDEDVFYYITIMNENYAQPDMPEDCEEGVVKGLYKLSDSDVSENRKKVRLLGSGAILNEVIKAAAFLSERYHIACEVYSVTSYSELVRDARETARKNRLSGSSQHNNSYIQAQLEGPCPVIAATDYVRGLSEMISPYLDCPFVSLGTDGFGRSDRRDVLREFFEVDYKSIVLAATDTLMRQSLITLDVHRNALGELCVDPDTRPPWAL